MFLYIKTYGFQTPNHDPNEGHEDGVKESDSTIIYINIMIFK